VMFRPMLSIEASLGNSQPFEVLPKDIKCNLTHRTAETTISTMIFSNLKTLPSNFTTFNQSINHSSNPFNHSTSNHPFGAKFSFPFSLSPLPGTRASRSLFSECSQTWSSTSAFHVACLLW
jgi:hypothetical protein